MQGARHLFPFVIIVLFCAVSEQCGKSSKKKRKVESTFLSFYSNNFQCEWHCLSDTTGRKLLPDVWKTLLEATNQAQKLVGISKISNRIQTTQPVILFKDLIQNQEWESSLFQQQWWRSASLQEGMARGRIIGAWWLGLVVTNFLYSCGAMPVWRLRVRVSTSISWEVK